MKSLLLALALVFSVNAHATSLAPGFTLTLPKVIENGEKTGLTAVVFVDLVKNEIEVQLFNDRCGQLVPKAPGQFSCLAAATLVESHIVPIVGTRTSCGSVYYIGADDQTPVDGLKVDIEVADHRSRTCMDVVAQYSAATLRTEAVRIQSVREIKMLHKNGF